MHIWFFLQYLEFSQTCSVVCSMPTFYHHSTSHTLHFCFSLCLDIGKLNTVCVQYLPFCSLIIIRHKVCKLFCLVQEAFLVIS